MKQTTLSEIAQKANLTIASISRILSGKNQAFNPETIAKVQKIAEDLHYRPNHLVRSLKTGLTGTVGVIIPCDGFFYGKIVQGIHETLLSNERIPFVVWSKDDYPQGSPKTELELIHALIDRRVEGIILKPCYDEANDDYFREIIDRNIPLVTVDRALHNPKSSYVGSNDRIGIGLALDHLKNEGHRAIAYLGPLSLLSTSRLRRESFQEWMKANPSIQSKEVSTSAWNLSESEIDLFFLKTADCTAVICATDWMAEALYKRASFHGRRIPKDLSVIGFGNEMFGEYLNPPLTTIDQHPHEIGRTAAKQLLEKIQTPSASSKQEYLTPELIFRKSVMRL